MYSTPEDRTITFEDGIKKTIDFKRATIDGDGLESEIGVQLDMTHQPPTLRVMELFRTGDLISNLVSSEYEKILDDINSAVQRVSE